MDLLRQQIVLARRRLLLQQFVGGLVWCWFVLLVIATVAIAASKIWYIPVDARTWSGAWLGGALGLGIVIALAHTWLKRKSSFDAATEIDRRFGLRERVASTLALSDHDLASPVGQALVSDVSEKLRRIHVAEKFRLQLDRRAWLPMVTAIGAFALAFLVDSRGQDNPVSATPTSSPAAAQVKKSTTALQKKLAEQKREAKEKGLAEAEHLFNKLEEGAKNLAGKNEVEQKQALVKLNDLAKDLEKRKQALGDSKSFQQQLNQLKDINKGPAEKMAQSLKNGDLQKAMDEVEKLKQQLAENKLDDQAKQELGKQLEKMQQALDQARNGHEQAKQDLQRQIEEKRQAGQTGEADKLQQQLDKLAQQDSRMDQLGQMSDKLGKAAQAMKNGQSQEASQQLSELQDELSQMQKENQELEMIDGALDQIADAKNAMKCDKCKGAGCEHCQGGGEGGADSDEDGEGGGNKRDEHGKRPGRGGNEWGRGHVAKGNPGEDVKAGFYDSKVKQKVGEGAGIVTDQVEGPNRKGQVQEQIKQEFEAAKKDDTDPLTGQRLPRDYRDHAKTYFDALRDGKQ